MSIKRDEVLLGKGFGEVTFINENCILKMGMLDGRLQTGELIYIKSLFAPTIKITSDGKKVSSWLDFSKTAVSLENWEKVRRHIDEMSQFFREVMSKYRSEFYGKC